MFQWQICWMLFWVTCAFLPTRGHLTSVGPIRQLWRQWLSCRCSAAAVPIWWNSLRVHPRQIRHKFKRLLKTFTFRRRERGTLLTDNLGTLANAFELSYLLTHIEVYFCHDDTVDTRSPIHRGSVQYQTQQRESRKARLRQDQCCNCLMRNEFCLV